METTKREEGSYKDPEHYASRLRTTFNDFVSEENEFTVGELVTWKEGLRNKVLPHDGYPMIVISSIENKDRPKDLLTMSDPNYYEDVDILCGVIDMSSNDDPTYEVFHTLGYESKRLRKFD